MQNDLGVARFVFPFQSRIGGERVGNHVGRKLCPGGRSAGVLAVQRTTAASAIEAQLLAAAEMN
jgi:hypothetical protein